MKSIYFMSKCRCAFCGFSYGTSPSPPLNIWSALTAIHNPFLIMTVNITSFIRYNNFTIVIINHCI
eukprot:UN12326